MTFDGANKRIILSSATTSSTEIWSEWVRWLAADTNNARWLEALKQVGGDDLGSGLLIPPYIFLLNGWRIRPMESNHLLVITGNIFVDGGGQPVVNTLGNYNVSIQYTVPVQAQGYSTTSSGSSITADEIWNYNNRSLTSSTTSSLTEEQNAKLMSLDTATIPASVWSHVTRTLSVAAGLKPEQEAKIDSITSKLGTTLDANIKAVNGTNVTTISDFKTTVDLSNIPAEVWNYVSRTLTVAAGLTPAQETSLNSILTKVNETVSVDPSQIWNYNNRTLTVASGLTSEQEAKIDSIKAKTDKLVFDITNRVLSFVNDKTDYYLNESDKLALANLIEQQIIDDTDSEKVLKAITDKIASVNPSLGELTLSGIATSVWSHNNRQLTQYLGMTQAQEDKLDNIPFNVWHSTSRTLTDKTADIVSVMGQPLNSINDFKTDISSIPNSVWSYNGSRTITNPSTLSASDIWTYSTRDLTNKDANITKVNGASVILNDFKTDISSIPSSVWSYLNRTTTDAKLQASDIWTYSTRDLTNKDANITKVNGSAVTIADFRTDLTGIPLAVWSHGTRNITNPNTLTSAQIWEYSSRSLTDKSADIKSINGVVVNSIEDFKTSLISIPAAVWLYNNRTTTDSKLLASDVWNYSNRELTNNDANIVSVGGEAVSINDFKTDVSNIPLAVWSYLNRTTTDSKLSASDIWTYSTRDLTNKDANITKVNGVNVTNINDFKPDVSNLTVQVDPGSIWTYADRSLTYNPGMSPDQVTKLNEIKSKTDKLSFDINNRLLSYIDDKTGYTLTSDEKISIANIVEQEIINESDSEKVLKAITDKIASVNPSLGELTLNSISSAVWNYINRELTSTQQSLTPAQEAKIDSIASSVSNIPLSVWTYSTRDLTNKDVNITKVNGSSVNINDFRNDMTETYSRISALPSVIWGFSDRVLTNTDVNITSVNDQSVTIEDFRNNLASVNTAISNIPLAVWGYNSKSLSASIPTLSDIWNYGNRSLTENVTLTNELTNKILEIPAGTIDANLIKVNGVDVVISDFRNTYSTSDIANAVWTRNERSITEDVSLSPEQEAKINSISSIVNYNDSDLMSKIDLLSTKDDISTISSKIDSKPSLVQIESSTVLAKQASLTALDILVNNIPSLAEIRDEMINVQFGGLEIKNNQMIISDKEGTIIAIFDLYNNQGVPTMTTVYKRVVNV